MCSENLLLKLSFFHYSVWIHFFDKKSGRDVSHGVYQKTSIKTELFILLTLDTIFSTQLQDNT